MPRGLFLISCFSNQTCPRKEIFIMIMAFIFLLTANIMIFKNKRIKSQRVKVKDARILVPIILGVLKVHCVTYIHLQIYCVEMGLVLINLFYFVFLRYSADSTNGCLYYLLNNFFREKCAVFFKFFDNQLGCREFYRKFLLGIDHRCFVIQNFLDQILTLLNDIRLTLRGILE